MRLSGHLFSSLEDAVFLQLCAFCIVFFCWCPTSLYAMCEPGTACPAPCEQCTYPPALGSNPTSEEWLNIFRRVSTRQAPELDNSLVIPQPVELESGFLRAPTAASIPCSILPALAATESNTKQFCDENGKTIISFDCGYGVMQITSDIEQYPGVEKSTWINVATGANILSQKWNADQVYGGTIGDSDPSVLESWYYALWAYNSFSYRNNPHNPVFPVERPPYLSPGGYSRGSYPYQEIVMGYIQNPQQREHEPQIESQEISYPENIPDQQGLFVSTLPLPVTWHRPLCDIACGPPVCPSPQSRVIVFDNEDNSFTTQGLFEKQSGGYNGSFLTAASSSTSATSTAEWSASAPATGNYIISAWIPPSPANASAANLEIQSWGGLTQLNIPQDILGGYFKPLGVIKLHEGAVIKLTQNNLLMDAPEKTFVGVDALRLWYQGNGHLSIDEACDHPAQCSEGLVCIEHSCLQPCTQRNCIQGTCNTNTGLCASDTPTIQPGVIIPPGDKPFGGDIKPPLLRDGGTSENDSGTFDEENIFIDLPVSLKNCQCSHSASWLSLDMLSLFVMLGILRLYREKRQTITKT